MGVAGDRRDNALTHTPRCNSAITPVALLAGPARHVRKQMPRKLWGEGVNDGLEAEDGRDVA